MQESYREKLYKIIAHSSNDYLSIANTDYEYLAVNQAYARGFNRKAHQIEGKKIEHLLGREDFCKLIKPNFDRCLAENKVVKFEEWFDNAEGRRFFSVSYTPIELDGERAVVVNAHDNTRHKVMEESLEKAVEDLKVANSYKDKLFSVVSHDVRAPIGAINNFLQLLGDEDADFESMRALVPLITNKLNTTKSMLDNLLGWASTQIKGESIDFEEFSLGEVVEENVTLFEEDITKKSLRVLNDVPCDLVINGDKNGVRMIIRNLFSNAIKFSYEGGAISVTPVGIPVAGFQTIKFSDEGKGMPADKARSLFSGIVNSEKGTHGEAGTGLGMMLTADSVLVHGGQIHAESKKGEGTSFYFSLPVVHSSKSESNLKCDLVLV